MTEKQFLSDVKEVAKIRHVDKFYHPFLSKWSEKGFPDCTIIKVPRLIFAELKSEKGIITPAQQQWFDLLRECKTVEAYIWRDSEYILDEIAEILR